MGKKSEGPGRGQSGAPLGAASPDEPVNTLPAEPSQITKVAAPRREGVEPKPAAREKRPGNEEPELTIEDDLPSDGRDEKGEAMIRNLPRDTGKEK